MEYLSQKEIKKELANMLVWFSNFAAENKIEYTLIGGTLLGAVRHQGFIPWDDDIDLAVTRNTYERIIELRNEISHESNGKYDVYSLSNNTSEFPFIKLINKEIYVKQVNIESKSGDYLWIDVFPFDTVPDDFKKTDKLCKKVHRYRLCLESALLKTENISHKKLSTITKEMLHPFFRLIGAEFFGKKIEELSQKYNELGGQLVCSVVWGYGAKETLTLDEFTTYTTALFEGREYPAIKAWDKYLTNTYGDYMQLPPAEKRLSHEVVAWRL